MKTFYSITIALSLILTSFTNADAKEAIMMDKFEDPIAGLASKMGAENVEKARKQMGRMGAIIEYKHCIQKCKHRGIYKPVRKAKRGSFRR